MSETLPNPFTRLINTPLRELLSKGPTGSLHWQTALAAAGLPAPIEQTIADVVRRSRLWRSERFAVTQELVTHFQDGLDSGAPPESLVDSFGQTKQAASLVRRAKRRCRPIWWQAWWWASRSAAGLIVGYTLLAVCLAFDRPTIKTDYLAVLNKGIEEIPVEDRAWPLYLEIAKRNYLEKHGDQGLAESSIEFGWDPDFDELGPDQSRQWIDSHQEVIALIRRASAKPWLATPLAAGDQVFANFDPTTGELTRPTNDNLNDHDLISTLLGHIQTMRSYARVLRQDALTAAEQADAQRALADLEAIIGIGKHCDQSPFLISGLVAIAINGIAHDLTIELLRESPELFTEEQLKLLASRVATIDYSVGSWLEGERAMFLDVAQRVYTDNGDEDGRVTAAGLAYMQEQIQPVVSNRKTYQEPTAAKSLLRHAAGPAVYFVFATRKETVDKHDAFLNRMRVLLSQPLWEITPEEWDEDALGSAPTSHQKMYFMPIELVAPATQAASSAVERARGLQEGWRIGLALELHRRETGDYPETLDQLAPRWLPEVPVDRINGTPLEYQVVDGKPIVYSHGIDADDDGGRPSEDYRSNRWGHRVGPPEPNLRDRGKHPHDGDWVIWSLAEPRYLPAKDGQQQPAE